MYSIYSIIYGFNIPKELSERMTAIDLTEAFPCTSRQECPVENFQCELPYDGSGDTPSIHLGIQLGCIDPGSIGNAPPSTQPDPSHASDLGQGIGWFKSHFEDEVQIWRNDPATHWSEEDEKVVQDFLALINNPSNVTVYVAHSTS